MPKRRKKQAEGDWPTLFLGSLKETGIVSMACRLAGVTRQGAYKHRRNHPEFAKEWALAVEDAVDEMLYVARQRAVEGVDEPVYHQGKPAGTIKRYSDSLLMFLIKAARPEYRDGKARPDPSAPTLPKRIVFPDRPERKRPEPEP